MHIICWPYKRIYLVHNNLNFQAFAAAAVTSYS